MRVADTVEGFRGDGAGRVIIYNLLVFGNRRGVAHVVEEQRALCIPGFGSEGALREIIEELIETCVRVRGSASSRMSLRRLKQRIIETLARPGTRAHTGVSANRPRVPPGSEAGILADATVGKQVLPSSQLSSLALFLNTTGEAFGDPIVRQAIATAIDRDAWTEKVKNGVGESATGWLPPGLPGYDPNVGSEYRFDAEKAKALLADAG